MSSEPRLRCPLCDRELPAVSVALAATHRGTQCPYCWVRLRRLAPRLEAAREAAAERRAA
jgi:DNA-directed RNA polymerase subunit RPC12/RpoP